MVHRTGFARRQVTSHSLALGLLSALVSPRLNIRVCSRCHGRPTHCRPANRTSYGNGPTFSGGGPPSVPERVQRHRGFPYNPPVKKPGQGGLTGDTYCVTAIKIGYARVSTNGQDFTAQRQALADLGVQAERVYVDHGITGTHRARPQYLQLRARLGVSGSRTRVSVPRAGGRFVWSAGLRG